MSQPNNPPAAPTSAPSSTFPPTSSSATASAPPSSSSSTPSTSNSSDDDENKKYSLKLSRLNSILNSFKIRDASNKPSKEIFSETNFLLKQNLLLDLFKDISAYIEKLETKYENYTKNLTHQKLSTVVTASGVSSSSSSASSSSGDNFLYDFNINEFLTIQKSADIIFFALYQTQITSEELQKLNKLLLRLSNFVVLLVKNEVTLNKAENLGDNFEFLNVPNVKSCSLLHFLYRLLATFQFLHISAHQQTTPLFDRLNDELNDLSTLDTFNSLDSSIGMENFYGLNNKEWKCNGTKAVACLTYAVFRQPAVDEGLASPRDVEWFILEASLLRGYNYIRCCLLPLILLEKSYFDNEKSLFYFCILSDLLGNLAKIFCMSHYKQYKGYDTINFPYQFFPPSLEVFNSELALYEELVSTQDHTCLAEAMQKKTCDKADTLVDIITLFNEVLEIYPPFSTIFWEETADSSNAYDLSDNLIQGDTEDVGSFHPFVMKIVEISKKIPYLFFNTLKLLSSLGQGPNGSTSTRVYLFLDQAKASLHHFNWVTLFSRLDVLIRSIHGGDLDLSGGGHTRVYVPSSLSSVPMGSPNASSFVAPVGPSSSSTTASVSASGGASFTTVTSTKTIRFTAADLHGLAVVLDLLHSCALSHKIAEDIYKKHRIIPRLFSLISCAFPIHIKAKAMEVLALYAKHGSKHFLEEIWNHLEVYQMFPVGQATLNLRGIACELEEVEAILGYYPLTNSLLTLLSHLFQHGIPTYLGLGYRIPGVVHYLEFVIEEVLYKAHYRYYASEREALAEKWRLTTKAVGVLTTVLRAYELKNISLRDGIDFVANPSKYLSNDQQQSLLHNKAPSSTAGGPPGISAVSAAANSSGSNSSFSATPGSLSSSNLNSTDNSIFNDTDLMILQDFLNPTTSYPIRGTPTQLNPSGYTTWSGTAPKDPAYHLLALFFGNTRFTETILTLILTLSNEYMQEQREAYVKSEIQGVLEILKLAYISDGKRSSHKNIKKMYSSSVNVSNSDTQNLYNFHAEIFDVSNENHAGNIDTIFWVERALASLLIFLYEISTIHTKFLNFSSLSFSPVKICKYENEKIIEICLSLTNFSTLLGGYNLGPQLCSYLVSQIFTCPSLPPVGVVSVSILQRLLMESPDFSVINSSDEAGVRRVVYSFSQALLTCTDEDDLNGTPLSHHPLYYSKTGEYFSQFYGGERSPIKCTVEAKQWEEKFSDPYDLNEKSNDVKAKVFLSHAASTSIRSVREAILQFLISSLSKNFSFPLVLLGFDPISSHDSTTFTPKRVSLGTEPDCFEAIVHLLTPYHGRQWINYAPAHALLAYELIFCLVNHPLVQVPTLYRLSKMNFFKSQLPFLINLFIHEKWEVSESIFLPEAIMRSRMTSSIYESKCDYLTCLAHSLSWTLQGASLLIAGHLTRPQASPYLAGTARQILHLLFGLAQGKSYSSSVSSVSVSGSGQGTLLGLSHSSLSGANTSYPLNNLSLLASSSSTLSSGASHIILSECLRKIVSELPSNLFDEYYQTNFIDMDKKIDNSQISSQMLREAREKAKHYLRPGRSSPHLFSSQGRSAIRPPVYSCIDVTEFFSSVLESLPSDVADSISHSFGSAAQGDESLTGFGVSSASGSAAAVLATLNKLVSSLILENQQARVRSSVTHLMLVIRQLLDLVCLVPAVTAQVCDTSSAADASMGISCALGLDYSPTTILGEVLLPLAYTLLNCAQSNPLGLPLDQLARGVNSLVGLCLKLANSMEYFVPAVSSGSGASGSAGVGPVSAVSGSASFLPGKENEAEIFYEGLSEVLVILMRVVLLTPSLSSVASSSSSFYTQNTAYISSITQPEAYISFKGSLLASIQRVFLFALKNTKSDLKPEVRLKFASVLLDVLSANLELTQNFSSECLNLTIFFPNTLWKCISIDTVGAIFNLVHEELALLQVISTDPADTSLLFRRTELWMALCQSLIANESLLSSIIDCISPLPGAPTASVTATPPSEVSQELYCSLLQFFTHMFSFSCPAFSISSSLVPFNSSLFVHSISSSLPYPSVFYQIVSKSGLLERVLLAENLVQPLLAAQGQEVQENILPLQLSLNLFTLCLNFETNSSTSFVQDTYPASASAASGKVLHTASLFYKKHYLYLSHFTRESISSINQIQTNNTEKVGMSLKNEKNSLLISFTRFLSALSFTNLNFRIIQEKTPNSEEKTQTSDEKTPKVESLNNFVEISSEFFVLLDTCGGETILSDLLSILHLLTFSPLPRSILETISPQAQLNSNLKLILSSSSLFGDFSGSSAISAASALSSSSFSSSFSSSSMSNFYTKMLLFSLAWKELEDGVLGPHLRLLESIVILVSLLSHRRDTILFLRPKNFSLLIHCFEQIIKIYLSSASLVASSASSTTPLNSNDVSAMSSANSRKITPSTMSGSAPFIPLGVSGGVSASTGASSSALVLSSSASSTSSTNLMNFLSSSETSEMILRLAEVLATTLHNFLLFYEEPERLGGDALQRLEMILDTLQFLPKSSYLSILSGWIKENKGKK